MAVITISRQEGCLGRNLAADLAKKIGWTYIDKEEIKRALTSYDVDSVTIEKYDEKKPSLLDSFLHDNEKYYNYFKLYFFEKALEKQGCILLGRGGVFLLKDVPGIVRIRIIASEKVRIKEVMREKNCDEKKAREIVRTKDREKEAFHKFYFHEDWDSPHNYDIVFNTDNITSDEIFNMLEVSVKPLLEHDTDMHFRKHLNNMLLAQRIVIEILYNQRISVRLLEVSVNDGTATLSGTVDSDALIKKCGEAAVIPGIDSVNNGLLFLQKYQTV